MLDALPSGPGKQTDYERNFNSVKQSVYSMLWDIEYAALKASAGGKDFDYLYGKVEIENMHLHLFKSVLG